MIEQPDILDALQDLAARIEDHDSVDPVLSQLGVDVDALWTEARLLVESQLDTMFEDQVHGDTAVLAAGTAAMRTLVLGVAAGLILARRGCECEFDDSLDFFDLLCDVRAERER